MKLSNKIYALALLSLGVFTSCEEDDTASSKLDKPVVSISSSTSLTLLEGESGEITLTTDKELNLPMTFNLYPVSATATIGDDYNVSGITSADWGPRGLNLTFPAFSTEATFDLTAIFDSYPEATETVEFELRAIDNRNGMVSDTAKSLTLTIENYVTPNVNDLDISFDWEADVDLGALGTYPACPNVDMDVYLMDSALWDPANPCVGWAMACPADSGFWDMATGNCPEGTTLTLGSVPDGSYYIVMNLYNNGFAGYTNQELPVTASFSKPGLIFTSFTAEENFTLDQQGSDTLGQGDAGVYTRVCEITINGGEYTISDLSGNVIAQG